MCHYISTLFKVIMVSLKHLEPSEKALNRRFIIFKGNKICKLELTYSIPKLGINFILLLLLLAVIFYNRSTNTLLQ